MEGQVKPSTRLCGDILYFLCGQFISTSCNRILWTFLPRAAVHGISLFSQWKPLTPRLLSHQVTYRWTWTGGAVPNFHVQTQSHKSHIWNLEKCSRIYEQCFSQLQLHWSLKKRDSNSTSLWCSRWEPHFPAGSTWHHRNQAELSTIFVPGLLRFGTLAKDKTSPAEVPRIYGCFFWWRFSTGPHFEGFIGFISFYHFRLMKNSFPPRSLTDFRKSFRHCLLVIELRVWSRKVLPLIVWFRRLSMRLSKVSPISEAGTCTFITCICPKISQ